VDLTKHNIQYKEIRMSNIYKSISIPVFVAATLLATTTPSHAYDFSYNYVEGSYASSTDDSLGVDIDSTIIGLFGSFEVSESVAITAGYAGADYDDIDVDATSLQIGATLHTSVGQMTDAYLNLSLLKVDYDLPPPFADEDDSGFGIIAGVRHAINDKVELEAAYLHVDIFDETSNQIGFGARFYFTSSASFGLSYATGDDVDTFTGDIRVQF
jgi:opacity protein-like surface antigen